MITFSVGANSLTVPMPNTGYETEIHLPIESVYSTDNSISFFDNDDSGTLDYRTLKCNFLLTLAQEIEFNTFFNTSTIGRGETVKMTLAAGSCFYPFGVDLGDVGDFYVRLIDRKTSGSKFSPKRYFEEEIMLLLVTAPTLPSPITEISQGELQIGNVTGLNFVQEEIQQDHTYNFDNKYSKTGVPNCIDNPNYSDKNIASINLDCNTSKIRKVIEELLTFRTNTLLLSSPENMYLFGQDSTSSGFYNGYFLGSEQDDKEIIIKIKHNDFNKFLINLSFIRVKDFYIVYESAENGIYENIESGIIEYVTS
jgi:hypothetical protein